MFVLVHVIPGGEARAVLGPGPRRADRQFNRANGLDLPIWDQFCPVLVGPRPTSTSATRTSFNQTVRLAHLPRLCPRRSCSSASRQCSPSSSRSRSGSTRSSGATSPRTTSLTGVSFIFYAMPAFLLGTLLILYFAIDLRWFPIEAPQSTTRRRDPRRPRRSCCRCSRLSAITIASFSRYMRSSMMETMTEDYIRTARAKGAAPRRVLYVHALRNALIPIITLLGLSLRHHRRRRASITETVFNYPGMGLLDGKRGASTTTSRCSSARPSSSRSPPSSATSSPTSSTPSSIPRIRYAKS